MLDPIHSTPWIEAYYTYPKQPQRDLSAARIFAILRICEAQNPDTRCGSYTPRLRANFRNLYK